jgi:hypothetical protein
MIQFNLPFLVFSGRSIRHLMKAFVDFLFVWSVSQNSGPEILHLLNQASCHAYHERTHLIEFRLLIGVRIRAISRCWLLATAWFSPSSGFVYMSG